MIALLRRIKDAAQHGLQALWQHPAPCIRPATASVAVATLADLARGEPDPMTENALFRHQLMILQRRKGRPVFVRLDRALLVLTTGTTIAHRLRSRMLRGKVQERGPLRGVGTDASPLTAGNASHSCQ